MTDAELIVRMLDRRVEELLRLADAAATSSIEGRLLAKAAEVTHLASVVRRGDWRWVS